MGVAAAPGSQGAGDKLMTRISTSQRGLQMAVRAVSRHQPGHPEAHPVDEALFSQLCPTRAQEAVKGGLGQVCL